MPSAPKLKVFRTTIGFHDAYVAAPSQKAALQAWGTDKDLFARGMAELVTDDVLAAEPLASPGKVVKRLRGTAEEQIAALPPDQPKRPAAPRERERDEPQPGRIAEAPRLSAPKPKPKPRPSRAALDAAEKAVVDAERRQAAELGALREREEALARERRALLAEQEKRMEALTTKRDRADEAHRVALDRWTRET